MEVLLMAVMGAANIVCFVIGAKVGQTVSKGEKVEMPSVSPIKAMKEYQAKKEADWETEKVKTIMANIESYDGTAYGQKEVPKG